MYDIALAKPVQISGVSDGMSAPVSASFNPSFVAGFEISRSKMVSFRGVGGRFCDCLNVGQQNKFGNQV